MTKRLTPYVYNIYYLHQDPKIAAAALIDADLAEAIKFGCNILTNCFRTHGQQQLREIKVSWPDYKFPTASQKLHPWSLWCQESEANYQWLVQYILTANDIWNGLPKNKHKTHTRLNPYKYWILATIPKDLPKLAVTLPPICVGEQQLAEHKYLPSNWESYRDYIVWMYREYYRLHKNFKINYAQNPARRPEWMTESTIGSPEEVYLAKKKGEPWKRKETK